jgi:hypothetical protein
VNVWDLAAQWSARRWFRRLRSRLEPGQAAAERDPAITAALDQHVQAVRTQLHADLAARTGFTPTPYIIVLAIYAEEIYREAVKAGWGPPTIWTPDDGISLRLLACCHLAARRNGQHAGHW